MLIKSANTKGFANLIYRPCLPPIAPRCSRLKESGVKVFTAKLKYTHNGVKDTAEKEIYCRVIFVL